MNKQNRGFTIIEVVLVIAIGGLIFAVVFAGIPQLQQSRRDSQRRRDLDLFISLLDEDRAARGNSRTTVGATYGNRGFNYPFVNGQTSTISNWGIRDYCNEYLYDDLGQGGDHEWKDPSLNNGYYCTWSGANDPPLGTIHYAWARKCNGNDFQTSGIDNDNQVAAIIALENGKYCQDLNSD